MFKSTDYDSFTQTRYQGLAVIRWGRMWRLADCTDMNNVATIGAPYKSKAEAMADVRYEADARGYKIA
jgi:hypothetical protein